MNVQYAYTLCRSNTCRTVPEPDYAERGLCTRCEADAVDALACLSNDYLELLPLVWDKTKRPGAPTGIFGPHDECDWETDALAGEIAYVCIQWAEIVADRASIDAPDTIRAATRLLAEYFTALICTPPWPVVGYDRRIYDMDGLDAAVALTALHRRARGRIGVASVVRQLREPCPQCSWSQLRHRDGGDQIWCGHCRATWSWAEYDVHVEQMMWGSAA